MKALWVAFVSPKLLDSSSVMYLVQDCNVSNLPQINPSNYLLYSAMGGIIYGFVNESSIECFADVSIFYMVNACKDSEW